MVLAVERTGGDGLGKDRVKFQLYTWNLHKAATQALIYHLVLQARAPYIVLMLLLSSRWLQCRYEDHFASDSPDSLARGSVWAIERERESSVHLLPA